MSINFSPEEKEKAFDRVASKYFERNFGMMAKADFETMIFDIYIEHLLNNNLAFDDYSISRALGISQSKVRALKLKKELQYPHDGFNWKDALSKEIKHSSYDSVTRNVSIPISDPNVMVELRYYIETKGWSDIHQLNPKVFTCRIDDFIKLSNSLSENNIVVDDETAEKLKEIGKNGKCQNAIQKICSGAIEDGLKDLAIGASKELFLSVLELLPFGGFAKIAIGSIIKVIERS